MLSNSSCHADVNANTGLQCSKDDYSATENGFQTNLNNLFSSLVNGALQNGFYKTTAGKNSNKVYGLIQCRGDISGNSCAGCTNNSITVALHDCPKSKETAVMDVGKSGKRYGMAQCTRDISSIDCGKCLDAQLVTLRTIFGSKRGWEIYGSSCFMWYHDFQFCSNISITASARGLSSYGVGVGTIIAVLSLLTLL
ncbi:hypothetical protein CMV_013832 [Castanea mollissima]|uniref:Gnk2-homologous domain-containing protein n=1 Tax=Castanea mollissima TaxID=60419 RepID=A0A8J4VHS7_9ROSI|nr:hypothetical protein CMV_013832 [Castanea mollissima]